MNLMTVLPTTIAAALLVGFAYLKLGRSVALKRVMLPVATAGVAALLALVLARSGGGGIENYAVSIPLGLSTGLVLQYLFDYCRSCGALLPLRRQAPATDPRGHRDAGCCASHRRR